MTISPPARSALARRLQREIAGDVQFDDFSRARYATDASPFQSMPLGVVLPRTQDDVIAAMRIAWDAGAPVIARGGGTGLSGQAVGEGLVIDFSKYLSRLLYYDSSNKTCIVEPGITLAALNAALLQHRVWFPVEIGSAGQATIGGMAGTDAIGWRALRYGRMRDNIVAMDAVLADGAPASFGEVPEDYAEAARTPAGQMVLDLLEAAEGAETAIRSLPALLGAQRGYHVEALLPGQGRQNIGAFLAGSEGTLALARRLELKLARRPGSRVLGVCHFPGVAEALAAIPAIVALGPTSVELTDRRILDLGIAALDAASPLRRTLRKDSHALVFVEFMEGNRVANARKLKDLADAMFALRHPRAVSEVIGAAVQRAIWAVGAAALQKMAAAVRISPALAPVEEIAVPLPRLAVVAGQIAELFARAGIDLLWHGHAGAGALHLRPWASAVEPDVARALAREAAAILAACNGAPAGENGYGLSRSDLIRDTQGAGLAALLEQIKLRFDPANRLNPGKIVFPPALGDPVLYRSVAGDAAPPIAIPPCDGNGLCRSMDGGLMMCPSFRVTRDERDSPRGRANSLRLAALGELGPDALASQAMAETMRLCVSCKACRVECPNAVDIAAAKIAVEAARRRTHPLSRFERSVAFLPHYGPRLRRWRHLLNLRDFVPWMAPLSERLTGLSADRPWPRWRGQAFSDAAPIGGGEREALLFLDCFNGYFDVSALRAAADVLAAGGLRVSPLIAPPGERPFCCGRTLLEAGLLEEARAEARRLLTALERQPGEAAPLVGLEPACLLTLRDEVAALLGGADGKALAARARLFEEVAADGAVAAALAPQLHAVEADAMLFSHCHQRACGAAPLARKAAELVPGLTVRGGETGCCGMGAAFGYRPDAVAVSLQMGEQALFPQIRRLSGDTLLLADGFACRKQIQDGTGRNARHVAVLLKLALLAGQRARAGKPADSKRLARWHRRYFR